MWKTKNGETGSGLAFALPDDEVHRKINTMYVRFEFMEHYIL